MSQPQERAFVQQLVRLEDDAWRVFFLTYGPLLRSFVCLCLNCPAEQAEEIVQMTFVRCIRSIRTYNSDRGSLMQWLKAIARNETRNLARQNARYERSASFSAVDPQILSQVTEAMDRYPLPNELVHRQDLRAMVCQCLMHLSDRQREVMILKYLDNLSVNEIAKQLGLTEKAVESLLSRGREAFRGIIAGKMDLKDIFE